MRQGGGSVLAAAAVDGPTAWLARADYIADTSDCMHPHSSSSSKQTLREEQKKVEREDKGSSSKE